jgi:hypothetical protein
MWTGNETEPVCWDGSCPVGFDQLDEEEIRLLELRGILGLLSDCGMVETVCRLYRVTKEDLHNLALLEMESRKMAKTQGGGNGGS